MSAKEKATASFAGALSGQSPPKVGTGEGSAKAVTRRLTLYLTPDAHRAFRTKAADLDTTMKAMLVAFVRLSLTATPRLKRLPSGHGTCADDEVNRQPPSWLEGKQSQTADSSGYATWLRRAHPLAA